MSVVLSGEPTTVPCEGCKYQVEFGRAVQIATVGMSGSNEFWHPDCLHEAFEEHPDWVDNTYEVCGDCNGSGDYDDVLRCENCDGSGQAPGGY